MKIVAETESLPEAWLFLGRARYALGDHDLALSAFSSFLSCRPDDPAGWFFTGRTYLAIGRAREAASCLQSAIDKGRNDAETWALLGFADLRMKRSGKAVASLETAVGLAPDDRRIFRAYLNALYIHAIRMLSGGKAREAAGMLDFVISNGLDGPAQRLYRARALRSEGRIPEAISEIDAAIAASPNDASLRLQAATLRFAAGDTEGAMNDINRSGATLPGQQGAPWTADAIDRWRALVALKEGNYKTALEAALNRIRHGETDAAIRAVAAQANYELHRFDRAAEHYRRAVEADPGSADLRMGLALSLWELHDYAGARKAAKSAAARGAPDSETLYLETICDVKTGVDPALILPKAQSLARTRPGDPRLMLALGECLYKTGNPDLADAWFTDVLLVMPQNELAMLYRISIAESLADDDSAIDRYGEYLAAYPDNSAVRKEYIDLLVRTRSWRRTAEAIEEGYAYGSTRGFDGILAACYRNIGRYREAAALYRIQLKGDPKNVDSLLGLAYSLYKSGAKAAAIELLERGAAFIGRNTEPYLTLGVLRARQGDAEKAAAAFLKASELAPADPRPLRNLARLYAKAGIAETATHFEERAAMLESGASSTEKKKKG
jgi:tetratricopeptide (TPR) repeat protein